MQLTMKLSDHFDLSEFEHSPTAIRLGIDNRTPDSLIPNLHRLCEQVLEPLRQHFNVAVSINSGYRCPALNRAVGGAAGSYHLQGRAADIPFRSDWYAYLRDHLPHTELLNEGTWIHIAL